MNFTKELSSRPIAKIASFGVTLLAIGCIVVATQRGDFHALILSMILGSLSHIYRELLDIAERPASRTTITIVDKDGAVLKQLDGE